MPNIEEKGNWTGKVVGTYLTDKLVFKCKMETEDGRHAYPSVFLLNQLGTANDEAINDLKEILGWDGENPNDLKTLAKDKTLAFYTKKKGDYWNAYFSIPSRQKSAAPQIAPADALSAWKNAKAGIPVSPITAGSDLTPPTSEIPF